MHTLISRLMNVVGRGRVQIVNDTGPTQQLQGRMSDIELIDQLWHMQHFGFASNPPEGSDFVALFIGGNRDNGCVIASGHQTYRPRNGESGGTIVYDINGQTLALSSTGVTLTGNGDLPLTVSGFSAITIAGDVTVNGSITATGDITAGTISLKNHLTSNVQPGSGDSGPPVAP